MTDLATVVEVLARSGVRFIIVGGVAANLHGSTRTTVDIDVVYDRSAPAFDTRRAPRSGIVQRTTRLIESRG